MSNILEILNEKLDAVKKAIIGGSTKKLYVVTGAAAISFATTVSKDFPDKAWKVKKLEVTFSSAPTTSESLTLTRSTLGIDGGRRPLTVIFSQNPSLTSATSILKIWEEGGVDMQSNDEVTLAFTNTDTRTVKAELEIEVL